MDTLAFVCDQKDNAPNQSQRPEYRRQRYCVRILGRNLQWPEINSLFSCRVGNTLICQGNDPYDDENYSN